MDLHGRAISRARGYLTAEIDLIDILMEVDRFCLYEEFGENGLTPYCMKYLGLDQSIAGCFVRVARACDRVPELRTALVDRRITLYKARAIASVITPDNKEAWLAKAEELPKEKLEWAVAEANGNKVRQIKLKLTEEQQSLFARAREIACQKLDHQPSLEETLSMALECFLDRHDPVRRAKRKHHHSNDERSREHSPLKTTKIPAQVLHAVHLRDRGQCQALLLNGKICGDKRWIQIHHIIPRSAGGMNTIENLTTLCSSHHRQWHDRTKAPTSESSAAAHQSCNHSPPPG